MPAFRQGPIQRIGIAAGRFYLDDVGSEIAQQLGGRRAHNHGRQIEDANTGKRTRGPLRRQLP